MRLNAKRQPKHFYKMIHKIIGFDVFGYDDEHNCIVKFNDSIKEWEKINFVKSSNRNPRVCIQYQGRKYGGSFNKLKFCALHGYDPKINTRNWLVDKDGKIITPAEAITRNRRKGYAKRENKANTIALINEEIEWLNASLDYYAGKSGNLLGLLDKVRNGIIAIVVKCCGVPASFAESCVIEAETQLLCAFEKASIVNAKRWLLERSKGIVRQTFRTKAFRISDSY